MRSVLYLLLACYWVWLARGEMDQDADLHDCTDVNSVVEISGGKKLVSWTTTDKGALCIRDMSKGTKYKLIADFKVEFSATEFFYTADVNLNSDVRTYCRSVEIYNLSKNISNSGKDQYRCPEFKNLTHWCDIKEDYGPLVCSIGEYFISWFLPRPEDTGVFDRLGQQYVRTFLNNTDHNTYYILLRPNSMDVSTKLMFENGREAPGYIKWEATSSPSLIVPPMLITKVWIDPNTTETKQETRVYRGGLDDFLVVCRTRKAAGDILHNPELCDIYNKHFKLNFAGSNNHINSVTPISVEGKNIGQTFNESTKISIQIYTNLTTMITSVQSPLTVMLELGINELLVSNEGHGCEIESSHYVEGQIGVLDTYLYIESSYTNDYKLDCGTLRAVEDKNRRNGNTRVFAMSMPSKLKISCAMVCENRYVSNHSVIFYPTDNLKEGTFVHIPEALEQFTNVTRMTSDADSILNTIGDIMGYVADGAANLVGIVGGCVKSVFSFVESIVESIGSIGMTFLLILLTIASVFVLNPIFNVFESLVSHFKKKKD